MNRTLTGVFWVLCLLLSLPALQAQESSWPRTLPLEQGSVTIYAPQVDEMSNDVIHFRAALAYRPTAGSEPVFGAGWFESPVQIDTSSRMVHPTDLKVTDTRFPAGTVDVQAGLAAALADQSPVWNLDLSLDEVEASVQAAAAETQSLQGLNTAPPRVIYRDHPALLVSLDGDPVLREIENSPLKAVINTPYPLIFNGRHYYLNAAKDVWYRADQATGPYRFEANPPADVAVMVNPEESGAADEKPVEPVTAANAPEIVVTTEPAELLVTEGPAAFVPLVDDLLVLQNSDDDVFMHVSAQEFYIVLAGRWYRSKSLDGPWAYQSADSLPVAFANIPQDSSQADARVYVAGTEEAREAVLDAQVPQTAAVERGEVDIEVEYDGDPVYQPVDGTADLVYIENTGSTVLQANGMYYLVEDGVWYVSSSPEGPWYVSDHRPSQVDTILPTSPVYNSKYVYVYDATPSVVYVGYTPGYLGSYVYHNTVFYGSGWYYRPWVSPYYYYPRYSTWGFNVSYNPWYGWSFGLSWGWGPFSVGYYSGGYWHNSHYWHHRHYGHWGPRGYRPRPVHYGHRRYAGNHHGRGGSGRSPGGSARPGSRIHDDNLYRRGDQRARVVDSRDRAPRSDRAVAAVAPSQLRTKASVRDAKSRSNQGKWPGDSKLKTYTKPERATKPYEPLNRDYLSAKATKNQAKPVPGKTRTANADKPARQRTTPVTKSPLKQQQPKTTRKSPGNKASPVNKSPSGKARPAAKNEVRQRTPKAQQAPAPKQQVSRLAPAVRQPAAKPGGQAKSYTPKQRASKPVSAPRQPVARSGGQAKNYASGQRVDKPSSVPKQAVAKSSAQPKSYAPRQQKSQKMAQSNSGQRSGSSGRRNQKAGGNRSKNQ